LEATKREPSAQGYYWTDLFLEDINKAMFLGDINMATWPSRLWGVSNETVKYGREFCETQTRE
jgi:hypothetical protein